LFLSNMFLKIIRVVISKQRGKIMDKIIAKIIEKILSNISDDFRSEIVAFVETLEIKANLTKNPWDDLAVYVLKIALDID